MGLYLGSNKLNINLGNDGLLANYYVSAQSQEKTVNLSTLKINKLTQEQYDRELANGNIDSSVLYLTKHQPVDLSKYATKEQINNKSDIVHSHDTYYTEFEIDEKLKKYENMDMKSVYQYAQEYGYTGTEEEFKEFFLNLGTVNEDVFLDLAIKPTTEKASYHNIQDSTDYRILDINMDGKTEQFTTTGKNIFDLSKVAKDDLIIAMNDTGFNLKNCFGNIVMHNEAVMSIFEPSTSYICTLKCKVISKPNSTNLNSQNSILLFYNRTTASACGFANAVEKNNWTVGQTYEVTKSFTTPDDLNGFNIVGYTYRDQDTATHSGEFEITEIMVRKTGETDATYEPFTNGASPNSNYQQDINNAGRYNEETGKYEIDVEICNKNLIPYPYVDTTVTRNGVTFTDNGDGSVTAQGTANRQAYFILNRSFNFDKNINAMGKDSGTNGEYAVNAGLYYNKANKVLSINIDSGVTVDRIYYPQLEKSTVSTPYIPHESQKVTLTSSRELTKWDKLEKRNGVYGWVYKGVKYVLDDTNDWWEYPNYGYNGFCCIIPFPFNAWRRQGYCNQLIANVEHSDGMWIGASNNVFYVIYSRFYDDSLADKGVANWKAHLKEHPLEVWTYLDTEEFEPLSQEEQNVLKSLETYYGVTNISNSEECMMQIQYVADTKNHIDNKLNLLQSAIVMS